MYVDLGAEKLIAAEKNGEKIAVEIKSFIGTSAISDFHTSFGQFLNYRTVLREKDSERALYLAVNIETYNDFFILPFTQLQIKEYQLKIIIYDVDTEEIVRWQN